MQGSNSYHALVFDFDGTLVDSNAIKRDCFFSIAKDYGVEELMEDLLQSHGRDRYAIFRDITDNLNLTSTDYDTMLDMYNTETRKKIVALPPFPGVMELLGRCRENGVKCFLSTATPLAEIEIILTDHPIRPYFESLHGKPATKMESLRIILDKTALDNHNLLVIGDGKDDWESASEMGCDFMAVGDGAKHNRHGQKIYGFSDIEKGVFGNGN